jgi:hypothetical protein
VATRRYGNRSPRARAGHADGEDAPATARSAPRQPIAARPGRTGVTFDPLLSFEEWRHLGGRIAMYSTASAWWLGDWLAFGQMKYGRRYREALGQTGLDYQTLRNYAMVARRFEPSRRRDNLAFQHHAEVCSLSDSEQDCWLDLALRNHWSKAELRRQVRAARPPPRAVRSGVALDLRLTRAREHSWRDAARRSGLTLDDWIIATLDRAAAGALAEARSPSRSEPDA